MTPTKRDSNNKVITLSKSNKVSNEPMSLAMSYLPYTTTLETNIYYAVLNKIAMHQFKDRDLFDVVVKVEVPIAELGGEKHFPRISKALKGLLNAKLSLINERKEFCRYLVPIIGTEYAKSTGKILVSIHPELLDEFQNMLARGYTSYQFRQMLTLNKFFSKRLYEILSGRWLLNDGEWTIDFDVLKRLLSAEDYPNGSFILRALKETAQEFEEKEVDIRFTYRLIKGAKNRIERVIFTINKIKATGELSEGNTMSFAENKELTAEFEKLTPKERNILVSVLLHKNYTFKHTQVEEILQDTAKMMLFYNTHNKIEAGLIPNVKSKTKYMATVLGYKDRTGRVSKG